MHTYTHYSYTTYALCLPLTDNHHLYVLPLLPSGFWFPPLIKTDFCRIPSHNPAEILFLFRRLKYHCSWNVFGDDATSRTTHEKQSLRLNNFISCFTLLQSHVCDACIFALVKQFVSNSLATFQLEEAAEPTQVFPKNSDVSQFVKRKEGNRINTSLDISQVLP